MNSWVGRFGDVVLVGALTFLCSLPIVTITAAQAAAFHTLDQCPAGTPGLSGRYLRSFRDRCRRGLVAQLLWMVPAAIAVVDLWFGVAAPSGTPTRTIFCGLGAMLLICAMIMRSCLAARLAADRDQPLGILARSAMVLAGASPVRTILVLTLDLITVAAGILTLAAVPFVAGFALALQARILRGTVERAGRYRWSSATTVARRSPITPEANPTHSRALPGSLGSAR